MHLDDVTSDNRKETAELFASHFSGVYSAEKLCAPCFSYKKSLTPSMSEIIISEDDVFNKLRDLKPRSTCGPDGIPPIIIKKCAD